MVNGPDHFRILVDRICDIFPNGPACHRQTICVEKILLIQFCHHRIDAARFIEVFHVGRTCGSKMTEIRRLLTDSVCKVNLKIHADLVSDGRKMKHTVGGTAQGHIYRKGIQHRLFRHDVSWTDIFFQ